MGFFDMFKRKDMSAQIKEYLEKNAVILDVRTQEEWNEGHIDGAKHIVLNLVPVKIDEIKSWKKPMDNESCFALMTSESLGLLFTSFPSSGLTVYSQVRQHCANQSSL